MGGRHRRVASLQEWIVTMCGSHQMHAAEVQKSNDVSEDLLNNATIQLPWLQTQVPYEKGA